MDYANRGMALENLINYTNEVYESRHWAVVKKIPTPIKILNRSGSKITGFLESPSTVDYDGVYQGRALKFEAKMTKEASSFPLKNFEPHQIDYMQDCIDQSAIVFAVIEFTKLDERYFVDGNMLVDAWRRHERGGPASIPYTDISLNCPLIHSRRGVPTDYLAVVDSLFAVNKTHR